MSSKLIAGDSDFFANLVRFFIAKVILRSFVPILWILEKLVLVSILNQAIVLVVPLTSLLWILLIHAYQKN